LRTSLNNHRNNSIATISGILLYFVALVCLMMAYFSHFFDAGFIVLYVVTTFLAAACIRRGTKLKMYGYTSMAVVVIAVAFLIASPWFGLAVEPKKHSPDPVGASAWANLFEGLFALILTPVKYLPVALPAALCWPASLKIERWPTIWHVLFGSATFIALMFSAAVFLDPALFQRLFR